MRSKSKNLNIPAVLFVCTGNRYRSPIAAAAFGHLSAKAIPANPLKIDRAGTWTIPSLPAIPSAITAAGALGLDITHHISCSINKEGLENYDLMLVMEAGHKEAILCEFPTIGDRVFLLSEVAAGIPYDIPDPLGPGVKDPEKIASEILNLIDKGSLNICQMAEENLAKT